MSEDRSLTKEEWANANFSEAVRRLPPPCPCFGEGAICPWCGGLHPTVTFGRNECTACGKSFCFGFPPWGTRLENCPESYVMFPFKEWHALGEKAHLLPKWEPNELLKAYYRRYDEIEGAPQNGTPIH